MSTLLVKGFSSVKGSAYTRTELGERRKTEAMYRSGCVMQWDIFECRRDDHEPGRMEGWQSKDEARPVLPDKTSSSGRYTLFNVRVPSISYGMKGLIEQRLETWPECGRRVAMRQDAGRDEQQPLDAIRVGFYLDYASLPDHAKVSLLAQGNCTLSEMDARAAIKHKADPALVARLFTEFVYYGE
jgi:hypothetical protein